MILPDPDPIKSPKYSTNLKIEMIECYVCKSKDKLEKHRIQPREFGGLYTRRNVIVVCQDCHIKIHKEIEYSRWHLEKYEWMDFVKRVIDEYNMRKQVENEHES